MARFMIALLVATSVLAYNFDISEYVTSDYDLESDALEVQEDFEPESSEDFDFNLQARRCLKYQCKGESVKMNKKQCVKFQKGTFHIRPCEGDKVCPAMQRPSFTPRNCVSEEHHFNKKAFPGESCDSNKDCFEEARCNNKLNYDKDGKDDKDDKDKDDQDDQDDVVGDKHCYGKVLGDECESSSECNPGLYCAINDLMCGDGTCAAQKALGESCESSFDCINSAGCFNSNCTALFTVKSGEEINLEDCDAKGRAPLCESYSCILQKDTQTAVCIDAPHTFSETLPVQCQTSADCLGTNNVQNVTSACTCGFNALGASYCDLLPGDAPYVDFLTQFKLFIADGAQYCNTLRRFKQECFALHAERTGDSTLLDLGMYAEDYPLYQNNDECVSKVYTRAFALNEEPNFSFVDLFARLFDLLH
jgi:hypothetical protein